jgi:hypothetical protein
MRPAPNPGAPRSTGEDANRRGPRLRPTRPFFPAKCPCSQPSQPTPNRRSRAATPLPSRRSWKSHRARSPAHPSAARPSPSAQCCDRDGSPGCRWVVIRLHRFGGGRTSIRGGAGGRSSEGAQTCLIRQVCGRSRSCVGAAPTRDPPHRRGLLGRARQANRVAATYHRTHGVTYFHGCYPHRRRHPLGHQPPPQKGTANTLTALKSIRAARPDGTPIHVILDNLSDHKGPMVPPPTPPGPTRSRPTSGRCGRSQLSQTSKPGQTTLPRPNQATQTPTQAQPQPRPRPNSGPRSAPAQAQACPACPKLPSPQSAPSAPRALKTTPFTNLTPLNRPPQPNLPTQPNPFPSPAPGLTPGLGLGRHRGDLRPARARPGQ